MNKILTTEEAIDIAKKLRANNKSIVLVGGFFDILHIGHIKFLENSKKLGDILFVLLESDEKARKVKGKKRPINSQEDRAKVLSSLKNVDYIIPLSGMTNNQHYDRLIIQIKPSILATTYGDPNIIHKQRQAELINAKVVEAIEKIKDKSTTKLVNKI